MKYTASLWGAKWSDTLPSGNGEIGAAVYGAINEERIMLTHADLWWKSLTLDLADLSESLSEVRKLLMYNKLREADRIIAYELNKLNQI
jgi:alpha-L-fucosidase 2